MSRIYPLSFLFLILGGCAIQPAVTPDYTGPVATIQETAIRVDQGKAKMFYINKINGSSVLNSDIRSRSKSQGKGNNLTIVDTPYDIPTQQQILTILGSHVWAMDGRAIFEADYLVSGDLAFTPKEGHTYLINGSLSKEISKVWVEDTATGEIVGKFEKENP